jgi:D-alanyl-D-alanine carboxypeptidase
MGETSVKKPDYLVLVNEDNRLPDNFADTIELIPTDNLDGEHFEIEKKTYEAFLRLQEDVFKNDGLSIALLNSYRTIETQEGIMARYIKNFGVEYAHTYVAKPGCSEHHTGFAIDVGFLLDGKVDHSIAGLLSTDHLFKVVHRKLPKYGFILRYPEGKETITNIGYEPWHFRYIDAPEIAKEITDKGICFEEYWQNA